MKCKKQENYDKYNSKRDTWNREVGNRTQCEKSSPENGYDQPAKLRNEILQKTGVTEAK